MHFRRLAVVLALATLTGCGTASLDPQAKATIKSIYIQPPKLSDSPIVAPPEGGAMTVAAGKSAPAGKDAVIRLKQIVDDQVQLSPFITSVASKELQARGYRIVNSPGTADAIVRFTVYYGLGISAVTSNARGVSMTINTELVRNIDGKRLLFSNANLVDPEVRAKTRHQRYEAWFENEALTVDQYKLVAENLVAQTLRGM